MITVETLINAGWKDPAVAFEEAIKSGRLSRKESDKNYAGHFMYMGPSTQGGDAFKNIITREYLS